MDFDSPQKARDLRQVKAATRFKSEEYIRYFENLNQAPNAEIGPKDIFEIASKYFWSVIRSVHIVWQAIHKIVGCVKKSAPI